jgi:glycosyltransferase involved in cell wall biosynthesis
VRILQLVDVDKSSGAAIAARRLADALISGGHEVCSAVKYQNASKHSGDVEGFTRSQALRGLNHLVPALGTVFEKSETRRWLNSLILRFRPEIVNIHSLVLARHAGLGFEITELCCHLAPVVWTLHDMWTFTGRCINNDGCKQFITGCTRSCPTANEFPPVRPSRIAKEFRSRRWVFSTCDKMSAIAPSKWLATQAISGLWRGHEVTVIPNSVPLDDYRPVPREYAREILSLERAGTIILCGALGLDNRRKGIEILVRSLSTIANTSGITLVSMGAAELPASSAGRFKHVSLGFVNDDRIKMCAYNAADFYVHSATSDNLPNMALEALACGTPVVAFPVGGLPEIVRDGDNGWLAASADEDSLTEAIARAISQLGEKGSDLRLRCRQVAEEEYSQSLQGVRYSKFFQQVISKGT